MQAACKRCVKRHSSGADAWNVAFLTRHPLGVAICAVAFTLTAGVFVFARPAYHAKDSGGSIKVPAKAPAADARGAAGWVWPDGVPGWEAGEMLSTFPVSGVQPVEIQAAQLAAAKQVLDASKVRVVSSIRGNRDGALMILAAPTFGSTPSRTCLAAVVLGNAPVHWECPGATPSRSDISHSYVLVAATSLVWPPRSPGAEPNHPIYLAGVARGDVYRVVLAGRGFTPFLLYTRGTTWGQFTAVTPTPSGPSHLAVYGRHGLLQTVPLNVAPGKQRIFR
jgi:hypothetical protein